MGNSGAGATIAYQVRWIGSLKPSDAVAVVAVHGVVEAGGGVALIAGENERSGSAALIPSLPEGVVALLTDERPAGI